jgi:hypothetical protein
MQLHTMLLLFKTMVQNIFCKSVQEILLFLLSPNLPAHSSLDRGFDLWKSEEVTGYKIR